MYTLSILQSAIHDIKEASEWYNLQQKGLGKQFFKRIREKGQLIQSYPSAFPIRYLDVHVAKVDQFPFLIHYTISESKNAIIIFAILHTSRNPKTSMERLSGG